MVNVRLIVILRGNDESGGLFASPKPINVVLIKEGFTIPNAPTVGLAIRMYQPTETNFPYMMFSSQTVIYDERTGNYDCINNVPVRTADAYLRYEGFGFVKTNLEDYLR